MDAKIVGFCGKDCFDIVYYLAKVGSKLNAHVTFVDLSGDDIIECLSGIDSVDENTVVDCGGFAGCKSLKLCNGGDYIFIYLGMKIPKKLPCEELYLVTDCQLHDIKRLADIPVGCSPFISLICRRYSLSGDYRKFAEEFLKKLIGNNPSLYIAMTATDEDSRTRLLYEGSASKVSSGIKAFITKFYSVDFENKEIQSAYKNFVKGK